MERTAAKDVGAAVGSWGRSKRVSKVAMMLAVHGELLTVTGRGNLRSSWSTLLRMELTGQSGLCARVTYARNEMVAEAGEEVRGYGNGNW